MKSPTQKVTSKPSTSAQRMKKESVLSANIPPNASAMPRRRSGCIASG